MAKQPYLSVVIPAYNEVRNFKDGVLKPSFDYLKEQRYSWEVVFVNDGSTDKTEKILRGFCKKNKAARLMNIPHGGRGAAYEKGMLEAKGRYILYTDFDQSTPIKELDKFWSPLKQDYSIVMGVRGKGENTKRVDSAFTNFRAEVYIFLGKLLFDFKYQDFNCGFKLYTSQAAKKIFSSWIVNRPQKIKGGFMGAVDVEILYLAGKYGYKVFEIPVDWHHRPTHGSFWKEPIMVFRDFMRIKILALLNKYPQ